MRPRKYLYVFDCEKYNTRESLTEHWRRFKSYMQHFHCQPLIQLQDKAVYSQVDFEAMIDAGIIGADNERDRWVAWLNGEAEKQGYTFMDYIPVDTPEMHYEYAHSYPICNFLQKNEKDTHYNS